MARNCRLCNRLLQPGEFGVHPKCRLRFEEKEAKEAKEALLGRVADLEEKLEALEKVVKALPRGIPKHTHPAPAIGYPIQPAA